MEFYIFVIFSILNLNHCESTKIQRNRADNDDFNQHTLSISASSSNQSRNSEFGSAKILGAPLKSEYDKKLYRVIRLPNGLTALLVSTQEEQTLIDSVKSNKSFEYMYSPRRQAACSLRVDVGTFSDPRDFQGLAHFVGNFDVYFFIVSL